MTKEDRALGAVIRHRRASSGMSQKDMAERLQLAPVVYGRIELGTRPVKALELQDICRALGISTDELLRAMTPVSPEAMVERAEARRDTAYSALSDYGRAILDAAEAIAESDHGAAVTTSEFLDTADDLVRWLKDEQPAFVGLRADPDLIPAVRDALANLVASVSLSPKRRSEGDAGDE